MRKYRMLATLLLFCTIAVGMVAQNYKQVNDICYTVKTDAYAQERLKLDVYYPEGKIARSIIGESPAFYTYLDELFQ